MGVETIFGIVLVVVAIVCGIYFAIKVNKKVYYNPTSSTWARTPLAKGLIFTKHMTVGSGGFSDGGST